MYELRVFGVAMSIAEQKKVKTTETWAREPVTWNKGYLYYKK